MDFNLSTKNQSHWGIESEGDNTMWNEPTSEQLAKIPRLYETRTIALKDKKIHLHFFIGHCDWFISEYDGEDTFFGYAILGNTYFGEWGYVSFKELTQIRVPPGIEVDCEVFDPPLKASEVEEIRIC